MNGVPPVSPPCPVVDLLQPKAVLDYVSGQLKPVDAVPTPLETWNRSCRDDGGGKGLAPGWHITLAANTGAGKSLLALNLAARAIEHGERLGFVSLEMSRSQVTSRLFAIMTKTEVRHLERGDSFDKAVARLAVKGVKEIGERTLGTFWMNDGLVTEIEAILDLMHYLHEHLSCRYFVVDYLQLATARDAETLFQQITTVSMRLREFAHEFGVITIGLSQLNRETSRNYKERPIVQGLMGGSPLENDSDQVVLLDHSRYEKAGSTARTWLILGKNRHGPNVEIPIEWNYRTLRVRGVAGRGGAVAQVKLATVVTTAT